jgi:small subunit ribosomal protein S6
MKNYEMVTVTGQNMPPARLDASVESLSSFISELGGTVIGVDRCGLRSLAYEIDKNKRGYYVVFKLQLTPAHLVELQERMRFDKDSIRSLIITVDEFVENRLAFPKGDESEVEDDSLIDYKNVKGLRKFVNVVFKMLPHRVTKLPLKTQKRVRREINRARFLSLMSYGA